MSSPIQRRRHRRLPRRHPVVVAAQRVDLAVVRDHAVGMRQRPGREGVGREALMHQRQRALEIRLAQIGIVGAELVGEEHALVDHGAAGDRHRVIARQPPLVLPIDRRRDRLPQDVEPALELVLGEFVFSLADENLHVERLGRLHRLAERRVVDRHVGAPAEDAQAFARRDLLEGLADELAPLGVARHEQRADAVFAGRRQRDAERLGLAGEELVRDLHQDAGAVAGARIGADRAAMLEVDQDGERVLDDLVRLAALDVGDESDAAGILGERGIVEAVRLGRAGIGGIAIERARVDERDGVSPLALACPVFAHPRRSHGAQPGRRHTIHAPQHRSALRPKGEPELRAAFSRAAGQHLAVPLIVRGVCCTRKHNSAVRNNAPRLEFRSAHQLGQQYCPITTRDCKSFLQGRVCFGDGRRLADYCASGAFRSARSRAFSASRLAIRSRSPATAPAISAWV